MALPVLILKTGNTLAPVAARHGDFERWFVEAIGPSADRFEVKDLTRGAEPAAPSAYAGIVITGSPSSMTVVEPWYSAALDFVRRAVDAQVPILGVCFGHQMLAVAHGGRVERNPLGREIGTVEVDLSEAGASDPLFAGLGTRFTVNATHVDAVTELPAGAVLLAGNAGCPVQAFALGDHVRTVQWHPEFRREVIRGYIEVRAPLLVQEGKSPETLLEQAQETPSGVRILTNFDRHFIQPGDDG